MTLVSSLETGLGAQLKSMKTEITKKDNGVFVMIETAVVYQQDVRIIFLDRNGISLGIES